MPACQYGHKMEAVAIAAFERETGLKTQKCGLFINETNPFLASSPDRIVFIGGVPHTIEVKCPFSCKDKEINVQNVPYLCNGDGKMYLKIISTMAKSKVNSCVLASPKQF